MSILARYQSGIRTLDIAVTDNGSWKQPQPAPTRGHALPLTDTLSSSALITTGPHGTTVTLRWSPLLQVPPQIAWVVQ